MRRGRRRRAAVLGVLPVCLLLVRAPSEAQERVPPEYEIRAVVSLEAPHVQGTAKVRWVNESTRALDHAVFMLFANRFAAEAAEIDDFNRPYVYPREQFTPGWMEIVEVRVDGTPAEIEPLYRPYLPDGTAVRVRIPRLEPNAAQEITLRFRTFAPFRFGTFGMVDEQLTLLGGWYPHLAALSADGQWLTDAPPPLADFAVELVSPDDLHVLLNGLDLGSSRTLSAAVRAHYLSLVAAPHWEREEIPSGAWRVVSFRRPSRFKYRLAPGRPPEQQLLESVADAVTGAPAAIGPALRDLVVIEAPLRLSLTADGQGAVIVSDRAFEVFPALRPVHEAQITQAVYAELLRPRLAERESVDDYFWVAEALSYQLARQRIERSSRDARSFHDWLDLLDVFAAVDRFRNAPLIPFVDAFFDQSKTVDPLRDRIATFNRVRPHGRWVMDRLRQLVGAEEFTALVEPCVHSALPFRRCLDSVVSQPGVDAMLEHWLTPLADIDYSIVATDLNERELDHFRSTVVVGRHNARPSYAEPVTVRLHTIGGRSVDLQWNSPGELARMSAATDRRVVQVSVDPDQLLADEDRSNNTWPPSPQIVLDAAELEVSSTEFGLAGLLVGRARYDYRKDVAVAAFLTNRSVGFTAGARAHWGRPIDATRYRNGLYLFYGLQELNGGFEDESRPEVRTDGQLGSLGMRYAYTNVLWFDHPTRQRTLGLWADWYDGALGSDFDYVDWGVSAAATHPLLGERTVGALQVTNGFSEPLGSSRVPNQGLYSLGGSRSIRGIGAEENLARNLSVVRAEVRHNLNPSLEVNFLDLFLVRRFQLRLLVDAGRVSNSIGRIYDVGEYALGAGAGLAAFYDLLGFFPASAYLTIATRVDRSDEIDDVQILFGGRQSF